VTQISTAKKAGIVARVVAHEAQRHAERSRLLRGAIAGGRAFLRSVLHAAHILWLQITGVFFAFFALAGGVAFWKEYRAWHAGRIGPGRAALALSFGLLFTWFAVTSFWRARRRSR
jgi:hypothetical protein